MPQEHYPYTDYSCVYSNMKKYISRYAEYLSTRHYSDPVKKTVIFLVQNDNGYSKSCRLSGACPELKKLLTFGPIINHQYPSNIQSTIPIPIPISFLFYFLFYQNHFDVNLCLAFIFHLLLSPPIYVLAFTFLFLLLCHELFTN